MAASGSIAERLGLALERRGMSVRQLHLHLKALPELRGKGTARSMIQRYLDGETSPPVEFLEVAAELLEVRPQWLAFGDGLPTDEAFEVSPENADRQAKWADEHQAALDAVFAGAPALRAAAWSPISLVVRSTEDLLMYLEEGMGARGIPGGKKEASEALGRALAGPIEALHLTPEDWPVAVRAQYVLSIMAALGSLLEFELWGAVRHQD